MVLWGKILHNYYSNSIINIKIVFRFALIRPHLLGIRHDSTAAQEGFIHFWAVMGHMLGVQDQYNMCLHPIETVKIICQMMLRYVFIPFIQLETPHFKSMVEALFAGMSQFLPHMKYDIQMFSVKRVIGVPGYQYNVDLSKEKLCRQLFIKAELIELREVFIKNNGYESFSNLNFVDGVPIFEIKHNIKAEEKVLGSSKNDLKELHSILGLNSSSQIVIKMTSPNIEWCNYLNDSKFYELTSRDQFVIRMRCQMLRIYEYRIGRYICESGLSLMLFFMKLWQKSRKGSK